MRPFPETKDRPYGRYEHSSRKIRKNYFRPIVGRRAPVAIMAYIRATPLGASSESSLVIAVPKAIAKWIFLTYDQGQAVMVAWRLFREAIAHGLTPSRITSACP